MARNHKLIHDPPPNLLRFPNSEPTKVKKEKEKAIRTQQDPQENPAPPSTTAETTNPQTPSKRFGHGGEIVRRLPQMTAEISKGSLANGMQSRRSGRTWGGRTTRKTKEQARETKEGSPPIIFGRRISQSIRSGMRPTVRARLSFVRSSERASTPEEGFFVGKRSVQ